MPVNLSNKTFHRHSFEGQDLTHADMRKSKFFYCNFDGANLEYADADGASFSGSTFRNTNCRCTNFRNADLQLTIFEPRDAYGMTITLACNTFKGMKISRLWWFCYLYFATLMNPELELNNKDPKDGLLVLFGEKRYTRLRRMFEVRGI